MAYPSTFTIDRQTWLRGEGGDRSYLYRSQDGRKCCLGFYGMACGVSVEQMRNVDSPVKLANKLEAIPDGMEWLIQQEGDTDENMPDWWHTKDTRALMHINDDEDLLETEREAQITEMFLAQGITITFIN